MSSFYEVCLVSDIPEGKGRMVFVHGKRLGVFHVGNEFLAIDDCCPHAGASLARGEVVDATVSCRIHHWRFCLRTGRYLDEDKPCYDVRTFPVRVVGATVQVALDSTDSG